MTTSNPFQRRAVAFHNEQMSAAATLLGIAQGLLADNQLHDSEIHFLNDWLCANETLSFGWPGNVILAKVREVLGDGIITDTERAHLVQVLEQLIGGALDDVADASRVTPMALDQVEMIDIAGRSFCLTGEFVFGPKQACEDAIERRGGTIASGVSKKVHYVVVGGLGSKEWKHGNFGTKIERAMQLKQDGAGLLVVHEDVWAASLV